MFDSIHTLHHAYVVEGDIKQQRNAVVQFCAEKLQVPVSHPDFFEFSRDVFTVPHAHEILEINSRRPITSQGKKVILITLQNISHQAQNALLKVLEEPQAHTIFFVLTPTSTIFLPTVLSRVHVLRASKYSHAPSDKSNKVNIKDDSLGESTLRDIQTPQEIADSVCTVAEFMSSTPAKRISYVKKIIDLKTKERIDDGDVLLFAQGIEKYLSVYLYDKKQKDIDWDKRSLIAQVIQTLAEYCRDVSSSKKMLLEYIALLLPKF